MLNMRTCKFLNILMMAVFFSMSIAFAEEKVTVSGSATAEKHPDGTVTTRKPTSSEINSLDDFRNKLKEIDRKYPGPEIPKTATLLKVTSVDDSGVISFENGQRIRMEGVNKCSPEVKIYLQKVLIGESDRAVYILSSSYNQIPAPAYVWHASLSMVNDPELKKYDLGPSYTALNETVLINGWCSPERSSSNAYNDRYAALSKIRTNR